MEEKYGLEELREGKTIPLRPIFFSPSGKLFTLPTYTFLAYSRPSPTHSQLKISLSCVLSPTSTHCQDSHALSLSHQPIPKEDDSPTKAVCFCFCFFFPFTTWKEVLPHLRGRWFWFWRIWWKVGWEKDKRSLDQVQKGMCVSLLNGEKDILGNLLGTYQSDHV